VDVDTDVMSTIYVVSRVWFVIHNVISLKPMAKLCDDVAEIPRPFKTSPTF